MITRLCGWSLIWMALETEAPNSGHPATPVMTGVAGWPLFGASVSNAIHIKDQPQSLVIIAYIFLIISSATLVLGLWYLLIAQVELLARMVDIAELDDPAAHPRHCSEC